MSLLKAQINTDESDPAVYLTQQLDGVYTDTDPRNYQLSSYSYLILPTKVGGQFNEAKGKTLGAFAYYAMCQAQQQSASLGYSPMPINLVQASFDQIRKIPASWCRTSTSRRARTRPSRPTARTCWPRTHRSRRRATSRARRQCPTGTGGLKCRPRSRPASGAAPVVRPGGAVVRRRDRPGGGAARW